MKNPLQQNILNLNFAKNILVVALIGFLAVYGVKQWQKDQKKENNKKVQGEQTNEVQNIYTQQAGFSTKTTAIKQKTSIKIVYKLPQEKGPIWLKLATQKEHPQIYRLIYHPMFEKLEWNKWVKLTNDKYTFLEKTQAYQSIEDFLKNPPVNTHILIDNTVDEEYFLPNNKVSYIDDHEEDNLDEIDYILTTYKPSAEENNFLVYENTIDATYALESEGNLSWQLTMASVSQDNPMQIDSIDVVYNQPKDIIYKMDENK
ncbi:hypothetical protein GYA19_01600 [Candidatus Beckwithbacteria bacterium]|nr:hypothetical protein [Candidatus Beckwithbacteria bacterium]